MHYVFAILIIALLVRETVPLGDIYVLRGITEGLALAIGSWWILSHSHSITYRKYTLLGLYALSLMPTIILSLEPLHVALQILSLLAIVIFFVAYVESNLGTSPTQQTTILIILCALTLVCTGSLMLFQISPSLAYDQTLEYYGWNSTPRFKGLFGKPATLAAYAGILLGISLFSKHNLILRTAGVISSIPCLYLTGSRSFWAGAILAAGVTAVTYVSHKKVLVIGGILCLLIAVPLSKVVDLGFTSDTQQKIIRTDSLENLSGRTTIWNLALARFWDRPWFGFGYTLGHHAFVKEQGGDNVAFSGIDVSKNQSFSLHNGYVQSLLDSGAVGTSLYLSVILLALWRMFAYDQMRQHASVMYSLVFLTIANFGETLIFAAATFYAVFYWYAAVLAISLKDLPIKEPYDMALHEQDAHSHSTGNNTVPDLTHSLVKNQRGKPIGCIN